MQKALAKLFWMIRLPLLMAVLLLAASAVLYQSYPHAAFLTLAMSSLLYLLWSGFIAQYFIIPPMRRIASTFQEGVAAFPEISQKFTGKNSLQSISTGLVDVFGYLKESLALYQQAIGSAAEAIITADAGGAIRSVNGSALKMFGYLPGEIIGQNLTFLIPAAKAESLRQYNGSELDAMRKDGSRFPIYLSVSHIESAAHGDVFFNVVMDLSMAKRREQELIDARDVAETANKAKDAFIANISHELRTPLNAILGFSEMLRFSKLTAKQVEYLEHVHNSGQSLLAIVNELLDLSAMAHGRLSIARHPFNLHKLLWDVAAGFELEAKEKNLVFKLEMPPAMPRYFLGDGNKLRQIVVNLLSNAIRFTDYGYVTLSVRPREGEAPPGTINLMIEIEDSGVGVAPEKREEIFERFSQADNSFTRKYGGTGLGLAICRELLELMEGTIRYESNHPRGSRFIVELPLELSTVRDFESAQSGKPAEAEKEARLRVLVAEDDFSNMALIKEFLSRHGCRIFTATNGLEAIAVLKQEQVDMLLLDISMPVMDGLETIAAVRKMQVKPGCRPVFIAAITANVMRGDEEKFRAHGFDDYVPKPISFDAISRLLEKYASNTGGSTPSQTAPVAIPPALGMH